MERAVRKPSVVTPERFASGMTFAQYLAFVGSAANLAREGSGLTFRSGVVARRDFNSHFRDWYAANPLSEAQAAAWRWLSSQPGGPAKILVISEDWSSDCRRDVPMLARLAEAGNQELRIFTRDGQRFSRSRQPTLAEAPDSNADIMAEFLNVKNGQTWQSIPVAAFFTRDLEYLYHYVEYPAIYHKDRIRGHLLAARLGETAAEADERGARDFMALQQSPFFRVWASAGLDEIISVLHERLVVGSLA